MVAGVIKKELCMILKAYNLISYSLAHNVFQGVNAQNIAIKYETDCVCNRHRVYTIIEKVSKVANL